MAIKAIFVGIKKHLDPSIPELSGARRDATSFWPLLTEGALPLTKISVRLPRGQCLALASIGLHTSDQLRALTNDRLRHCVGLTTAALLQLVENIAAVGEEGEK